MDCQTKFEVEAALQFDLRLNMYGKPESDLIEPPSASIVLIQFDETF